MSSYTPIEGVNRSYLGKCRIILIVISSLFCLLCIAMLAGGGNMIIDRALHDSLEIKKGSKAYYIWKDNPIPLYMKVYIFNLVNPDDFLQGALPEVEEVGPFTFSEYHHKTNISEHANSTITYMQRRKWIWQEELSEGHSLDENFTMLNVLPVTAAHEVRYSSFLLMGLDAAFRVMGEKAVITKSARQILFEGYKDPMLSFVQSAEKKSAHYLPNLEFPIGLDRFGWFYKRNNSPTYDGVYNMFTGEDSLENVGKIDLWNHKRHTNFFDGKECNKVTGSAGEIWPPGMERNMVEFFNSDICSTLRLFYDDDIEDKNGIHGYRFTGTEESFERKEKDCFCVKKKCTPKGTLNAESCKMGAPAAVSFPHFLYADPSLVTKVKGLNPDPRNHTFSMSFIPELGIPMEVMARMQINIQVEPLKQIQILKNVSSVLLPMIWFEVSAELDKTTATQLQQVLLLLDTPLLTILYSVFLFLSILVILITVTYSLIEFLVHRCRVPTQA